jgi:hypothetical protein
MSFIILGREIRNEFLRYSAHCLSLVRKASVSAQYAELRSKLYQPVGSKLLLLLSTLPPPSSFSSCYLLSIYTVGYEFFLQVYPLPFTNTPKILGLQSVPD